MEFRLGQGYDIHRITPGRRLVLGGHDIHTDNWGLLGHSDADVLLHAIIDALLGALALGDIGQWFADTDQRWLNADSRNLLRLVLKDPQVQPWQLQNLDSTVITQMPKLAPHILPIRHSLATLFDCELSRISVKAKSNEQLDAIGKKEAIAAHAVVLIAK